MKNLITIVIFASLLLMTLALFAFSIVGLIYIFLLAAIMMVVIAINKKTIKNQNDNFINNY